MSALGLFILRLLLEILGTLSMMTSFWAYLQWEKTQNDVDDRLSYHTFVVGVVLIVLAALDWS